MQNVYDSKGVRKVNSFSSLNTDNAAFDAFGRLRTSTPVTIFDSKLSYDTGSLLWDTVLTAGGTSVHRQNESSVRMTVSATGDAVLRQSRQYLPYRPGKSLLMAATFVMGAHVSNVAMSVGFFDDNNGIFFRRETTGILRFGRRTYTSGASATTFVNQTAWNIDPFDGTGPSGVTLDVTKAQILMIDLQWLGVGRVRIGFDVDGVFWPAHEFLNANSLTLVYMTTATLPIRYQVTAPGGAVSGAAYMDQICSALVSEGGFDDLLGFPRSASNAGTTIAVTGTKIPILSVRPKATYGGITNRMFLQLEEVTVYSSAVACQYDVIYNGSLTGAAFASAGTNSAMEYDVTATAITGGDVVNSGYVPAAASQRSAQQSSLAIRLPLTLDSAGANPINLSVAAIRVGGAGTADVAAALQWREIQ